MATRRYPRKRKAKAIIAWARGLNWFLILTILAVVLFLALGGKW